MTADAFPAAAVFLPMSIFTMTFCFGCLWPFLSQSSLSSSESSSSESSSLSSSESSSLSSLSLSESSLSLSESESSLSLSESSLSLSESSLSLSESSLSLSESSLESLSFLDLSLESEESESDKWGEDEESIKTQIHFKKLVHFKKHYMIRCRGHVQLSINRRASRREHLLDQVSREKCQ